MITIIAWRNIWRNKVRSLVVMGAIVLGIWAVIFAMAFMFSLNRGFINNSIEHQYSHIQLHHPEYKKDQEVKYLIENSKSTLDQVRSIGLVKAVSSRLLSSGMIASSKSSMGILIKGVDPESEAAVTKLDEKVTDGTYFEGVKRNPMLISEKLGEKLQVKLRSKVVLTFQDLNGEITAAAFRVVGFYNTGFAQYDERNVFVRGADLAGLLGTTDASHEIAIYLHDPEMVESTVALLKNDHGKLLVEGWRELAPELDLIIEQIYVNMLILMSIIMVALTFGIINTMLMAVLERVRELGMLMSIGMNKLRIFLMIVFETVMLALVGGPVGMLLGFLTVYYFGINGIDMSMYSEGLQEFGMQELIRPYLEGKIYMQLAVMVMVTSVLGSIYPAIKALQLKPVEAIRVQ